MLYVQADNAPSEAKNHWMFAILALLCFGVYETVELHLLPVGHTHENIDAFFSCVARALYGRSILNMKEFSELLHECWASSRSRCSPVHVKMAKQFNFDSLADNDGRSGTAEGILGHQHFQFKTQLGADGVRVATVQSGLQRLGTLEIDWTGEAVPLFREDDLPPGAIHQRVPFQKHGRNGFSHTNFVLAVDTEPSKVQKEPNMKQLSACVLADAAVNFGGEILARPERLEELKKDLKEEEALDEANKRGDVTGGVVIFAARCVQRMHGPAAEIDVSVLAERATVWRWPSSAAFKKGLVIPGVAQSGSRT